MARDIDYAPASDFLANFFGETTEHAVEIRALPNDRGAGPVRPLFGRDGDLAITHLARWDAPERAVYFGVATRLNGAPSGTRADLAELPALWTEIDTEKLGLEKDACQAAAATLPLPPSLIIDSGRGLHLYWLLREALDVRAGTPGARELEDDIVATLRQLAGCLSGDIAVAELARIMRLPGTHNTKDGGWRRVEVLEAAWGRRYDFADLQDMLDTQRPVIDRPAGAGAAAAPPAPDNPFAAYAAANQISAPVDITARLDAMSYLADGDAGIHQTQLHVSASLVAQGTASDDDIVALLLPATQRAAGPHAFTWNWRREEAALRRMIETARWKFGTADGDAAKDAATAAAPSAPADNVVPLAPRPRATARSSTDVLTSAPPSAAPGPATAPAPDTNERRPLIARIGDAVLEYWQAERGQIAVVEGQPYTYAQGVWKSWDKGDQHALRVAIQGVLAAGKIDPKTQLLNAVARYVLEQPSLLREGVIWDASGLIVCMDGAVEPLSRAAHPHSPDHWATVRAEVRLADLDQGCPQWLAFLDSAFSDLRAQERTTLKDTIAEWFGAALVRGKPRELRKALWLHGESRTGKTRISEVCRLLVGEPTISLKVRALEKQFGAAAFIRARAWIADDAVGSADDVDDAIFKVIVTGESFSTDVKNAEHVTMRLEMPVLLTSNSLPRVRDQSDAVFNRSLMVHMRVVRGEEETAGVRPIDEIVGESELAGVFSWALDGWARLAARGRFLPPASMLEAAAEFKSSNNVVASWVKEALSPDPLYMVDRRDTYASFKGWYTAEFGEAAKVPSSKFVTSSVKQLITVGADYKRHGYPCLTGVKLTDDGLLYRREGASREAGNPGSGCAEADVNQVRPVTAGSAVEPSPGASPRNKQPRF